MQGGGRGCRVDQGSDRIFKGGMLQMDAVRQVGGEVEGERQGVG